MMATKKTKKLNEKDKLPIAGGSIMGWRWLPWIKHLKPYRYLEETSNEVKRNVKDS